ncbi:AsnC family protein [Achromobacter insolitus]|uniref:AsnC family protein n=1 Tax=Achromobacter insolitus TaxID=217204 RepID=UPI00174AF6A6|nr:AsnC family protein [Achromobacter insolitus]
MTLSRPGAFACALLMLALLAPAGALAACSDKTVRGMSDAGRSVATIAKRCGMSATAVKERLGAGDAKANRAPAETATPRASPGAEAGAATAGSAATSIAQPAEKPEAKPAATAATRSAATAATAPSASAAKPSGKAPTEPQKHPPGTVLELCGCYGSMEYGFTEPNAQCVSGKAVATRCPGYCPVNRSPWRRICS